MIEFSKLPIDQLLMDSDHMGYGSPEAIRCLKVAEIKLLQEQTKLTVLSQELSKEQLQIGKNANDLTKKLLISNEQASKHSEQHAKALNDATVELAKSTTGLKRATWILAIFTGIQVILAIVNFYFSLHASKP
jgi:hypothetical protein